MHASTGGGRTAVLDHEVVVERRKEFVHAGLPDPRAGGGALCGVVPEEVGGEEGAGGDVVEGDLVEEGLAGEGVGLERQVRHGDLHCDAWVLTVACMCRRAGPFAREVQGVQGVVLGRSCELEVAAGK